ncbi:MAG: TonB-dependent receptor [Cyclobacteriaceae bacterium]|nr:TonB-dependent receptor [Cyclobacteriaceae bacterium]MDH4298488.1 TonB-dependent receptor [Cyclobacteriaceae bacterium]MDH5247903.1 TonB-dependent receptor [Cyclobacteriaceae bacterium]
MRSILLSFSILIASVTFGYAQRTVTGTITSSDDATSVPGVNILLKGTATGTVTDIDGNYSISVPNDGGVLIVSFVGFDSQEIEIGNQSIIDVTMVVNATQLSEVVVVGYTATTQKKLVSAVSIVDKKRIENIPVVDINQIIQGRAAGVRTTAPSGQPGAQQNIRIRGTGSITGSSNPLYVVDGVIVESGDVSHNTTTMDILSNLNPGDIENMTILKDASATALYGARAANGVILITTKQGKSGETKITAKIAYGSTSPLIGNLKMMDGQQAWDYERQVLANSGFDQATIDAVRPASLLDATTNWVDEAFRTGHTKNFELQASGGNEKTQFYISGGAFAQDGTLIGSSFKRYTTRMNLKHSVSEKLDFGTNFNLSYTDQLNANSGATFSSPLLGAFVNTPLQSKINPDTGELYTGLEPDFSIFTADNFLYSVPRNPSVNNTLRTLAKVYATYHFTDKIGLTQNVGLDFISMKESSFLDPTTGDGSEYNGAIVNDYSENITLTSQTLVNFEVPIGDNHIIDGVAGFEYQQNNRDYFLAFGKGLATGQLQTLQSTAEPVQVDGSRSAYRFISYLGQANYNYKEKYFLSASIRYDASSRFGTGKQWAPFWSLAGGWRFHDEAFMSGVGWISDGKLRINYGTSGNAAIGDYGSLGLYSFNAAYNGIPGSQPNQIANPNLSWEQSRSLDIGLDLGFIENRIFASMDYYRRNSDNLLLNVPVSRTTGFSTALKNIGEMQNSGFELTLTTVNFDGAFRWSTDFNVAWNKNKIVSLPGGEDILNGPQISREGIPIQSFYVQKWKGVNPADGTPLWAKGGFDASGNYTGEGETTTGVYGQADRYIVGNATPKFTGGLNNAMSYKGITFSFFFIFVHGNKVSNESRSFIESDGQRFGWNYLVAAAEGTWQNPGDVAERPQPLLGGNNSANAFSTRYLEDGSFVRLRNVTLGYSLPKNILGKSGIKNVYLYATGQNLWVTTKYSGFDPEMDQNGREFFRYPVGKSYTFGVDITF